MMACVAGVDGCPAGWIVVLVSSEEGTEPRLVLCKSFDEILCLQPRPRVIVIDIPIGLLDERVPGGRDCDREARMLLGRPRSSSVFLAPPRAALSARSYDDARPHGLTLQAFGILPKVREVDAGRPSRSFEGGGETKAAPRSGQNPHPALPCATDKVG